MADSLHLFHRYKIVALILVAPDQIFRRYHRLRSVGAHRAISAIVQQDYIAAAHLPCDLLFDHRGGRSTPVVAGYVPHHGFESKFTRDPEGCRASSSKGRTK